MHTQIPIIDLGSALTGDPAARLLTGCEIDRICTEIGFSPRPYPGSPDVDNCRLASTTNPLKQHVS
jgi:hypothetical protein